MFTGKFHLYYFIWNWSQIVSKDFSSIQYMNANKNNNAGKKVLLKTFLVKNLDSVNSL